MAGSRSADEAGPAPRPEGRGDLPTGPAGATAGPGRRLVRAARFLWVLPVAAAAIWWWSSPSPDALYERARVLALAGHYEEAESVLGRLARLRAPTPADRLVRAQVASGRGRDDAAVAELAEVPDGHPLGPLARLSQGQIEARRGRLRAAEAAFLATLALEPGSAQARRELVYIYSIQQRPADLDAQLDALSEQGALDLTHLLHWGQIRHVEWAAATDLDALRRYVAADADDRHSRLALAEALWRTGRADEAGEVLAPLPSTDPDARAARARLALARGDRPAAGALLADGPDDHPALARARGRLALARGDARAAADQFRRAAAIEPGDRGTLHSLVVALSAAGEADEAESYRKALARHDELGELLKQAKSREADLDSPLLLRLAQACDAAGRPLEARAWAKRAIARDPLDAEAQRLLHRLAEERPSSGTPPKVMALSPDVGGDS
jgi:tetratricopeptide (TPR) repeat protein